MIQFSAELRMKASKESMAGFEAFLERARKNGASDLRLELFVDLIECAYMCAERDIFLRVNHPQPDLFEVQGIEVGHA